MKHLKLTAVLLIAAMAIMSCKKSSDNSSSSCTNTTNWLKDGHELVYVNNSFYIPADTLYQSFTEVSTDIFKNTSQFDDGSVYPTTTEYAEVCGNSVYQAATSSMAGKQEAYRLAGNVGDHWTITSQSQGGVTVTTTTTIASTNTSVTVPMGTYNCIDLQSVSSVSTSPGNTITTDTYINSEYGPVKVFGTTTDYELARVNFN